MEARGGAAVQTNKQGATMSTLHPWIPEGVREPDQVLRSDSREYYRWGLDCSLWINIETGNVRWGRYGQLRTKATTTAEPFPQELFEMIKL